jgi:hypothetical protein
MEGYSSTLPAEYETVLSGNQYMPAVTQYDPDSVSSAEESLELTSPRSVSLLHPYSSGLGASLVESQKYVLPRFLTTHLAQGYKWDYSDILRDLRARSSDAAFEAYLASLLKLTHLYEDFVRSARLNAKVLIGMLCLFSFCIHV